MIITLDIETIPGQKEGLREEIAGGIAPPGNYKKAETIEAWEKHQKPGLVEEQWLKTSFNGSQGEIIAISYAIDDRDPIGLYRGLEELEGGLLADFYTSLVDNLKDEHGRPKPATLWVGHYITGFDLRFLWQRSVIHQIRPSVVLPYNEKPWGKSVYDTCIEWKGLQGSGGSMEAVCAALGIEGKGEIDGSKVWDYVKAGKEKEVSEYCTGDVERTRQMYKRQMFL